MIFLLLPRIYKFLIFPLSWVSTFFDTNLLSWIFRIVFFPALICDWLRMNSKPLLKTLVISYLDPPFSSFHLLCREPGFLDLFDCSRMNNLLLNWLVIASFEHLNFVYYCTSLLAIPLEIVAINSGFQSFSKRLLYSTFVFLLVLWYAILIIFSSDF